MVLKLVPFVYRPVADLRAWSEAALSLLAERQHAAARRERRDLGISRARRFAWTYHADQLAALYHEVLK